MQERGPADMETSERMKGLAAANADARKHKAEGEHETAEGLKHRVSRAEVEAIIEDWPEAPKMMAHHMLERYGEPNEATPTKLFWYENGVWKRSILTRDIVTHNFPMVHSDFLTQYIDYPVPVDKVDDIVRFDGSVLPDRTAGEVGARCDSEWANTLTMNLMHEIVTGRSTVEEARKRFGETASAYALGRPAPEAERLQFEPPREGTEDPDESIIAGAMARQTLEKVKDVFRGEPTPP